MTYGLILMHGYLNAFIFFKEISVKRVLILLEAQHLMTPAYLKKSSGVLLL